MDVLNAAEASDYLDSEKDERDDGAVSVIHWALMEHSSALGRLEHFEPTSPLDILVLYQAVAVTFRDWNPDRDRREELLEGGRILRWEEGKRRSESIPNSETAALATRFANRVIGLSANTAAEQDLDYFVKLFLHAVEDPRTIDGIVSGSISRYNKQLTDLDQW